jgi:aspartate racemase
MAWPEPRRGEDVKIPGLIGGIAPESTVEYYRFLIREYQARVDDASYPALLINSIDLATMIKLVQRGDLERLTAYLSVEVQKLAKAGADFVAFASNTPHIVFDEIRSRSPVPMVSIVEAACEAALDNGVKRAGLLGTRFTMQGAFYDRVFSRRGISIVVPEPSDQDYIHEKYMGELVKGVFRPETRERLLEIAARLQERQQADAIVLGGTELPLILRDAHAGLPFLDTTLIHVKKIVTEMLKEDT